MNMYKAIKYTLNSKIRSILMILILSFDIFTDYEILIYLLCTLLVVISFFLFLKRKKQIKECILYIKLKAQKYDFLVELGIALIVVIITFVIFFYFEFKLNSMIPITFGFTIFLDYNSTNFLDSIRLFQQGIQLPKKETITNWKIIDEIALNNQKLLIIISGETYQYSVSETDVDDAHKLIENFKVNKKL